jgi:hypothetical protein
MKTYGDKKALMKEAAVMASHMAAVKNIMVLELND